MTQNKLVAFCYLFIIGICICMAFPASPAAVSPLWYLAAALLAASAAGLWYLRRARPPVEDTSIYDAPFRFDGLQVAIWALVLVTGFVLGYARYLSMIQSPDTYLGTVTIASDASSAPAYAQKRDLSTTSYLKLRLLTSPETDVTLRVHGRLEALLPIPGPDGAPILDSDGRWNFSQSNVEQHSEPLTIPAGTPAGTEVILEQAFTHVDSVTLESPAPSSPLRLDILQPVNTVALFARPGRDVVPVSILGRITADPWVYSFKTVLAITPEYLQHVPGGPYFKIARQTARVTIEPDLPSYADLACSAAYGYDVAITGELIAPSGAANKGAFDQAKYLRNYNIGGQMTLRAPAIPGAGPSPIRIIRPAGEEYPREGNPLTEFALYLRDSMVRVIKQTMPQPNSAFLGALTLGLRYGMQNTVSIASDNYDDDAVRPLLDIGEDTDTLIADEFKASGINHVLAVSGLHVTIITIMFMGIFTILKVSKKVYVPFVIFALVIFAIITGARPSTLRAVIMNSLFLLTWGYMGQGVRSSALLGVPIAAFIILIQNPAMAVDPSFTLSFGAILSLALLTQPFFDIFKKFEGNNFLALLLVLAVLTYAFAAHWLLVVTVRFWLFLALLAAALFALARFLDRSGIRPIGKYGFADIPPVVAGFIAAQFGMQIGMMIPLSAYYFYRWPVAGAYANLLAIPLVGVVLQLSMLSGLIGLIPGVGIYVALVLNAANWIFSTGFLLIGHYFSSWFAYPFVAKPTLAWIFVYYAACAIFIWWRPLWFRLARPRLRRAPASARIFAAVIAAAVVLAVLLGLHAQKRALRPAGQLAISVLSVGYGSAILVDTPDSKAILVDTGHVQTDRGRRNEAERTILPYICSKQISRLDALVLSSPNPEHVAGAPTILRALHVPSLRYPASVQPLLDAPGPLHDILASRSPDSFRHRLAGTTITPAPIAAGDILYESKSPDGTPFSIQALSPTPDDPSAPLSLRIAYGDFSCVIAGDLTFDQQKALLRNTPADALAASVVIAPAHGTADIEHTSIGMPASYDTRLAEITGALLAAASPSAVIYEFGNPRPVVGDKYKTARKLHGAARRAAEDALPDAAIYATDTDGAITILSDGSPDYSLSTQYSSLPSDTDAPTSLEIGW